MKVTEKRLAELRGMLHGFQSYNASVAFSGCDVGTLLGELLGYLEAEPQGAPPTTLEQAWDEGFEEGEGARRENPYRAKGAPERVTIEHPPGFGLSLDAELLAAKGAPQKPESG